MNGQQPEDPRQWVRAVNEILRRLETGELKPGRRLPAMRVLAGELGVNEATAASGYRYLKDQGIIRANPGGGIGGYIVCKNPQYTYPANPACLRPDYKREAAADEMTDGRFGVTGDTRAWVLIANRLLDRIRSGQYAARLPLRADLAAEAGTGIPPVTRACQALVRAGFVAFVPGHGYAVLHAPGGPPALEAAQSGAVLDWLKTRHGDGWEAIEVTWSARCRTGNGQTVTAGTAGELDALLSP